MPFISRIDWKKEIPKLIEYINNYMTYEDIGNIYNVSRQRIKQVLKQHNIEINSQKVKRETRKANHYKKYGDKTQSLYSEKRRKFSNKKYNAKRTGREFTISFSDLDWPDICPILGIPLDYLSDNVSENSASIDQIIPDKGYIPGNVVIISWRANRIKNNGSSDEHFKIAQWLQNKGL
jgi:hypothetical protein